MKRWGRHSRLLLPTAAGAGAPADLGVRSERDLSMGRRSRGGALLPGGRQRAPRLPGARRPDRLRPAVLTRARRRARAPRALPGRSHSLLASPSWSPPGSTTRDRANLMLDTGAARTVDQSHGAQRARGELCERRAGPRSRGSPGDPTDVDAVHAREHRGRRCPAWPAAGRLSHDTGFGAQRAMASSAATILDNFTITIDNTAGSSP